MAWNMVATIGINSTMLTLHSKRERDKKGGAELANAPPSPLAKRTKKGITMQTTKIKLQRLQLGLTLEKMAERLGVKQRTYQRYEKGEREMPKPVAMLHEALKRNAILERNEQLTKERGKK